MYTFNAVRINGMMQVWIKGFQLRTALFFKIIHNTDNVAGKPALQEQRRSG